MKKEKTKRVNDFRKITAGKYSNLGTQVHVQN